MPPTLPCRYRRASLLVDEASEPWCGATLEGREQCIQPIVSLRVTTYAQLFCHFRGSLRPFRSERHVWRLASGRSTKHDPPPVFPRAQAVTQMALICRQGLHAVLMAPHAHPSGPLVIRCPPAPEPLVQSGQAPWRQSPPPHASRPYAPSHPPRRPATPCRTCPEARRCAGSHHGSGA